MNTIVLKLKILLLSLLLSITIATPINAGQVEDNCSDRGFTHNKDCDGNINIVNPRVIGYIRGAIDPFKPEYQITLEYCSFATFLTKKGVCWGNWDIEAQEMFFDKEGDIYSDYSNIENFGGPKRRMVEGSAGISVALFKIPSSEPIIKGECPDYAQNCICAQAYPSGWIKLWNKSDRIGCAIATEKPGPPILNNLIMPTPKISVEQPCEKECSKETLKNWYKSIDSKFESPKIPILISNIGQKQRYIASYDFNKSPNAQNCISLPGISNAKYCPFIQNQGALICINVLNNKKNYELGCVPRPSIAENSNIVPASGYMSSEGKWGILPLKLVSTTGEKVPLEQNIGRDSADSIYLGQDFTLYKYKKDKTEKLTTELADCNLAANLYKDLPNALACKLNPGIKVEPLINSYLYPIVEFAETSIHDTKYKAYKAGSIPIKEYSSTIINPELSLRSLITEKDYQYIRIQEADQRCKLEDEGITCTNCNNYEQAQDQSVNKKITFVPAGWKDRRESRLCYCGEDKGQCKAKLSTDIKPYECDCTLCIKKIDNAKVERAFCPGRYLGMTDKKQEEKICLLSENKWDFISGNNNPYKMIKQIDSPPNMMCNTIPRSCMKQNISVQAENVDQNSVTDVKKEIGEVIIVKCAANYFPQATEVKYDLNTPKRTQEMTDEEWSKFKTKYENALKELQKLAEIHKDTYILHKEVEESVLLKEVKNDIIIGVNVKCAGDLYVPMDNSKVEQNVCIPLSEVPFEVFTGSEK